MLPAILIPLPMTAHLTCSSIGRASTTRIQAVVQPRPANHYTGASSAHALLVDRYVSLPSLPRVSPFPCCSAPRPCRLR
ncbi:hypothetical protein EJ06DRAFT_533140 [Trichodelitschia bisporula]|uniref:Uncharacterized protein n=1 Tax=Trichodelitschia bisporula TaxID=703511 RepID=A0A6G1HNU7_9PEZI|nr:hypothetical protein EJ06DRAFT_533140 [Trichodelitschia bisporula]